MLVLLMHLWLFLGTVDNTVQEIDPQVYDGHRVYSKHSYLKNDKYSGYYSINSWVINCKKKSLTHTKHQLFKTETNEMVREEEFNVTIIFTERSYAGYAAREYWCK